MAEDQAQRPNRTFGDGDGEPVRAPTGYARGVRTALHNNATAYGFSIAITSAYGLLSGPRSPAGAMETLSFAIAGVIAFVAVEGAFVAVAPGRGVPQGERSRTITGSIDMLSVLLAVGSAFGLSLVPGFVAWPLTAFGAVVVFLLVGGVDVLIARTIAARTKVGRSP